MRDDDRLIDLERGAKDCNRARYDLAQKVIPIAQAIRNAVLKAGLLNESLPYEYRVLEDNIPGQGKHPLIRYSGGEGHIINHDSSLYQLTLFAADISAGLLEELTEHLNDSAQNAQEQLKEITENPKLKELIAASEKTAG